MNKVFLIGNLTKDPELLQTNAGLSYCKFSLAVNRPYSNNEEEKTDFFNCTVWKTTAENLCKFKKKGDKIALVGSVQIRNYEDRQGNKKTSVDIAVNEIEFLPSKVEVKENKSSKPKMSLLDTDEESPF